MKKEMLSVALVLGLGMTQARAQEQAATEVDSLKKQSVVGKIVDDLKESTRAVHEINKENVAAEKEAFKARHAEATEVNPDFEEFKQADGLKEKAKVVIENIKNDCKENSEKEKVRRKQIKSHESYREISKSQREKREAALAVDGKKSK